MEDAHLAVPDLTGDGSMSLFGVFDGHGGCAVARFAAKHLAELLLATEQFKKADYQGALAASFLALDDRLVTAEGREELKELECSETGGAGRVPLMVPLKLWTEINKTPRVQLKSLKLDDYMDNSSEKVLVDPGSLKEVTPETQGCTAVVALIAWAGGKEGDSGARLFVANAGDSRCILSRRMGGDSLKVQRMSEDHKPELESEASRIKAGGGVIHKMPGGCRVQGDLNLSRALGDFRHKQSKDLPPESQIVTAFPEVRDCCLGSDSHMLILGCDGIWEMNRNRQLAEKLRVQAQQTSKDAESKPLLSAIAAEVCDSSLCPSMRSPSFDGRGCDNMTLLIVELNGANEQIKQCSETDIVDACHVSSVVSDVLDMVSKLEDASDAAVRGEGTHQCTSNAPAADDTGASSSESPNQASLVEAGADSPQPNEYRAEVVENSSRLGNDMSETVELENVASMGSTAIAEVTTIAATTEDSIDDVCREKDAEDATSPSVVLSPEEGTDLVVSEADVEPSEKRRKLGA